MDRQPVVSSNIKSVGYDQETATFEVEFTSGAVYQYLAVPGYIWEKFLAATSQGEYLAKVIKPAYQHVKVAGSSLPVDVARAKVITSEGLIKGEG